MKVYAVVVFERGYRFDLEVHATSVSDARMRASQLHPFGRVASVQRVRDESGLS